MSAENASTENAPTDNVVSKPGHVVALRYATISDASEIARLLTQLGHATTTQEVVDRWPRWEADGNSALVAAIDVENLVGLCTLHEMRALHRPKPVGRITSLVVEENRRGQGIGRMLVVAAEDKFVRAGCGLLEVTSNLRRVDAHAFYETLGYEKSSFRLVREIAK